MTATKKPATNPASPYILARVRTNSRLRRLRMVSNSSLSRELAGTACAVQGCRSIGHPPIRSFGLLATAESCG
jgi:hypothetical protein